MLKLKDTFIGAPVLSLRTGGQIAQVQKPIINPNNLKIEGWYVQDIFNNEQLILLSQDIRDFLPQGFAVNDHEVLTPPTELIRLKDILEQNFDLSGKDVTTTDNKRVGKVSDYAVETKSLYIQKLYASQSILKSLSGGSLSIDRSQIIEITNKRIVIEDPLIGGKVKVAQAATTAN